LNPNTSIAVTDNRISSPRKIRAGSPGKTKGIGAESHSMTAEEMRAKYV